MEDMSFGAVWWESFSVIAACHIICAWLRSNADGTGKMLCHPSEI